MDLLNNIIIGINELYVCKYLLDLDLTLMNIWRDNYYLESDYDSKMKLSIISLFAYSNSKTLIKVSCNLNQICIRINNVIQLCQLCQHTYY